MKIDDFLEADEDGWHIDWYTLHANEADVVYAKEEHGKDIQAGDVLLRLPKAIGPIDIDYNGWTGYYLKCRESDALLAAAAPDLLAACELLLKAQSCADAGEGDGFGYYVDAVQAAGIAIAKAKGKA